MSELVAILPFESTQPAASMSKRINSIRFTLAVVFAFAASASYATNINTFPAANASIAPFGETDTATYGQTITIQAGSTQLDSFSFALNDYLNSDTVDFAAYVMGWDSANSKATGGVLYASAQFTTTNNGGADGYEYFTFNTGGLNLVAGSQYVLFLNASNFFDGDYGTAYMPLATNNPYSGGGAVYINNGSNFGQLTTTGWADLSGAGYDMGFTANFSAGSVPDAGSSLLMAGCALLGLAALRRKFSRA